MERLWFAVIVIVLVALGILLSQGFFYGLFGDAYDAGLDVRRGPLDTGGVVADDDYTGKCGLCGVNEACRGAENGDVCITSANQGGVCGYLKLCDEDDASKGHNCGCVVGPTSTS
jgi:hypothetical protein